MILEAWNRSSSRLGAKKKSRGAMRPYIFAAASPTSCPVPVTRPINQPRPAAKVPGPRRDRHANADASTEAARAAWGLRPSAAFGDDRTDDRARESFPAPAGKALTYAPIIGPGQVTGDGTACPGSMTPTTAKRTGPGRSRATCRTCR